MAIVWHLTIESGKSSNMVTIIIYVNDTQLLCLLCTLQQILKKAGRPHYKVKYATTNKLSYLLLIRFLHLYLFVLDMFRHQEVLGMF